MSNAELLSVGLPGVGVLGAQRVTQSATGQRVGPWLLQQPVQPGPRPTLWRALNPLTKQVAALELLPPAVNVDIDGEHGAETDRLAVARQLAGLQHPHLAPVIDVSADDEQPAYVANEWIDGESLASVLERQAALEPRVAVELMIGVVDVLRLAHKQGIVHGDLRPANVLLDGARCAWLTGFGHPLRVDPSAHHSGTAQVAADAIHGAAGWISPEAAAGAPPSPIGDVFAAGLLLAALLQGRPMIDARDSRAALQRLQSDDLLLDEDALVDDHLRSIVQRALAREPDVRFDDAAGLRDALAQWLEPVDAGPEPGASGNQTLDRLLHRMRRDSDFPALSAQVLRILRLTRSDRATLPGLAEEVLQDVALTGKLLRLVNSAYLRRDEQGVSTVSRAVALVGLSGVRNLALSLALVDHMHDKAHARRLRERFTQALLAAHVAQELADDSGSEAEEAFLAALFYNLGPLLVEFYFPDAARAVRERVALLPADAHVHPDRAADQIAQQVLGLGWEALGLGVARQWGLPERLQQCMRRPESDAPPRTMLTGDQRLRWLAVAANDAANAMWQRDDETLAPMLQNVAHRYDHALALQPGELRRAALDAQRELRELAPVLGLALPLVRPAAPSEGEVAERLSRGLDEIRHLLGANRPPLHQLLQRLLEIVHAALGCRRTVLCVRDAAGQWLVGRAGLGDQAEAFVAAFKVSLQPAADGNVDLLSRGFLQGAVTLLPNLADARLAAALPAWFKRRAPSGSCLLLSLSMRNAPLALIYADDAGLLPIGERERAQLRALRETLMRAF